MRRGATLRSRRPRAHLWRRLSCDECTRLLRQMPRARQAAQGGQWQEGVPPLLPARAWKSSNQPLTAHLQGPCNSWTFCGYPVCWGLDTGWNHTYGECWLRSFADPTTPTFGQRGALAPSYRKKFLRTRSKCKEDLPGGLSEGWSCPPTHVPWTSGSLGGPLFDPKVKWETSGGWGNMRIHKLDNEGVPMVETCSKNAGQPC